MYIETNCGTGAVWREIQILLTMARRDIQTVSKKKGGDLGVRLVLEALEASNGTKV